jgi:hypothetical protein
MSGASLASARLFDLSDALDVFGLKVTTSLEEISRVYNSKQNHL